MHRCAGHPMHPLLCRYFLLQGQYRPNPSSLIPILSPHFKLNLVGSRRLRRPLASCPIALDRSGPPSQKNMSHRPCAINHCEHSTYEMTTPPILRVCLDPAAIQGPRPSPGSCHERSFRTSPTALSRGATTNPMVETTSPGIFPFKTVEMTPHFIQFPQFHSRFLRCISDTTSMSAPLPMLTQHSLTQSLRFTPNHRGAKTDKGESHG